MATRSKNREPLLWDRPEVAARTVPLTRERIADAALAIADRSGLADVSFRKIGEALDAGAMRLYGYVKTKDELLELLVDRVYAEMLASGPLRGPWRNALKSVALRLRAAGRAHPWFIELVGHRPHLGPSALAFTEASLAAAQAMGDIDVVMQALDTVTSYAIGALRMESAEAATGLTKKQWQAQTQPYMQKVIATGAFPMLERVYRDATHPSSEKRFERGLELVLDGIAASA